MTIESSLRIQNQCIKQGVNCIILRGDGFNTKVILSKGLNLITTHGIYTAWDFIYRNRKVMT